MEARLALEPELARLAAVHATPADLDELAECVSESRAAGDWRSYEYWDNRLHRAVAQAAANIVLLALFDGLNTIRRTVTWGRLRRFSACPDPTHHSFAEHDRLVGAIAERDAVAAADAGGQLKGGITLPQGNGTLPVKVVGYIILPDWHEVGNA